MKVRCYFRDTGSENNVGRVDVDMDDETYELLYPKCVYEDAISEVQGLLWQGGKLQTVFAVVTND